MTTVASLSSQIRMVLAAKRAADLMTFNPVTIQQDRSLQEAAVFFSLRGVGAAPVVDEAGRPVGMLSRTDVFQHTQLGHQRRDPWREVEDQPALNPETATRSLSQSERGLVVGDLMTPVVHSVRPGTTAVTVVERMISQRVRRLFVVNRHGVLVGLITAWDVLRQLEPVRDEGPDML